MSEAADRAKRRKKKQCSVTLGQPLSPPSPDRVNGEDREQDKRNSSGDSMWRLAQYITQENQAPKTDVGRRPAAHR
jgi:hypothetical protein